nr:unnamed protein product [Callosobruchus chinensis]
MVAASKILGLEHIPCFAHTLNLVVQNALAEIKPLHSKVKSVVEFFKRSSYGLTKLKATQKNMNLPEVSLKQDVPTRWNSSLLMFQTVVDNEEPIITTLALLNPNLQLDSSDFADLRKICHILQPFKEITDEVSSETAITISKIILFSRALNRFFEKLQEEDETDRVRIMIKKIKEELKKRFFYIEERKILAEATFLDPRFKKDGFINDHAFQKAKQSLVQKVTWEINANRSTPLPDLAIESQARSESKSSIWSDFDSAVELRVDRPNPTSTAIIEIDKYLQEPLLDRRLLNHNPFGWWHERQIYYPHVYKIMKKRLCIVGSSVPSERVFSKTGNILTQRRASLRSIPQ